MNTDKMHVKAFEIKAALAEKHSKDFFVTECKNGPTQTVPAGSLKILDGLAIKKSWTAPCFTGYEIKVSRSDFLRDAKFYTYEELCNCLYVVCPKGMIERTELPEKATERFTRELRFDEIDACFRMDDAQFDLFSDKDAIPFVEGGEAMKALTIWQPWASLIACGTKRYETRSWATKYRGPIAIHAAARDPNKLTGAVKEELERAVRELFNAEKCQSSPWRWLPTGAVIATAELVSVWHIAYNVKTDVEEARKFPIIGERMAEDKHEVQGYDYFVPTEKEIALGDWTPGRYAWKLANVKILPEPIPVKGKQGLWKFEMEGVKYGN